MATHRAFSLLATVFLAHPDLEPTMNCLRFALIPALLLTLGLAGACPPAQARQVLTRAPDHSYEAAFDAMDSGQTDVVYRVMQRGSDPVLNKVLKAYLMAQPGNDYSFDELAAFVTDNPDWPGLKGILMIAEQKIPASANAKQVANWFNAYPPLTAAGFYRYIDALDGTGQTRIAESQVRNHWIEASFSKNDREAYYARYSPLLGTKDHAARLDRLLWEQDAASARAMFPYVSKGLQALAEARLGLASGKGNPESLIAKVPASLQHDSGLLFERLRFRRQKDDDSGAIEILSNAPAPLVHPEIWWKERHIIIRRVIEKKEFALAYRLASHHGLHSGFPLAEAEFLSGWLSLRFLNKPTQAETHFKRLIDATSAPISQGRGYYWLGRTYEALGRKNDAEQAYEAAATLDTTFYGQLATTRLYAKPTIHASSEPSVPAGVQSTFFGRDSIRAIEKLYAMHQTTRAETFFRAALTASSQRVAFALLLELAYELQRPDWAVVAAKAANQKNFILRGAAYPLLAMNIPSPPEIALTHALIRQESQFQADAGSRAGARGLMQLMPGTAKGVAGKLGVRYSPDRLTDPDYNVMLGTAFIERQIDNFNGSYVLALAGYNAGPRRVREWVDLYGDPRTREVDPVDWIELIPIYETRNYVQRIMENLQFYRARLSQGPVPLRLLEDLKR